MCRKCEGMSCYWKTEHAGNLYFGSVFDPYIIFSFTLRTGGNTSPCSTHMLHFCRYSIPSSRCTYIYGMVMDYSMAVYINSVCLNIPCGRVCLQNLMCSIKQQRTMTISREGNSTDRHLLNPESMDSEATRNGLRDLKN